MWCGFCRRAAAAHTRTLSRVDCEYALSPISVAAKVAGDNDAPVASVIVTGPSGAPKETAVPRIFVRAMHGIRESGEPERVSGAPVEAPPGAGFVCMRGSIVFSAFRACVFTLGY